MNRDEARELIRSSLQDYLENKGIDTSRAFRCLNPAHEDRHPSMSYDKARRKVHCFACGADYDTIALIQVEYNLKSAGEAFSKAYEIFRIDVDGDKKPPVKDKNPQTDEQKTASSGTDYLKACAARSDQTDYFAKRGLSAQTVKAYGLGFDPQFQTKHNEDYATWSAVTIPTGNGAYVVRNTQSQGKDDRIRKRGAVQLFGIDALEQAKTPIFIVEGEFDALSIIEAGGCAIALGSVANGEKLLKRVKECPPSQTLILALDNDESGERASLELWEALGEMGVSCEPYNVSGSYNDPNEALIADREAFIASVRDAEQNVKRLAEERLQSEKNRRKEAYIKTNSALSHIADFVDGIARSIDTPATGTGFSALDEALDGGLYEGLYILGAISSLGKTSYCLQMADQIAAGGRDVLFFSLEMARTELMAKSVSRMTKLLPSEPSHQKTARGITDGRRYADYSAKERKLIRDAIDAYAELAGRMYIVEGVGDIGAMHVREAVKRHIDLTGESPVVFVDYLQLLMPAEIRATDKQNMDRSVLELKRISRDYKIPLIAISSFNRESYRQTVNMAAFKESGAIEYSSDVLIGLQAKGAGEEDFDIDEAKRMDPREVELVVLKNRNGRTGEKVEYRYHPMYNCFYEVPKAAVRKRV